MVSRSGVAPPPDSLTDPPSIHGSLQGAPDAPLPAQLPGGRTYHVGLQPKVAEPLHCRSQEGGSTGRDRLDAAGPVVQEAASPATTMLDGGGREEVESPARSLMPPPPAAPAPKAPLR